MTIMEQSPLLPKTPPISTIMPVIERDLPRGQKFLFGFGNILNDVTAAVWFSYTLLFFQSVLGMDAGVAGVLLFWGQVIDGVVTPIVGYVADNSGDRKRTHMIGSILVVTSFPLVFTNYFTNVASVEALIFYACVIAIFQIGWAIVQISHLSMIPELPGTWDQRTELTNIRYTTYIFANISVYLITWYFLNEGLTEKYISRDDYPRFIKLIATILALGVATSIIFHRGLGATLQLRNRTTRDVTFHVMRKYFFHSPTIYQVTLLYVAARLFLTLNLVYFPLFLDENHRNLESRDSWESQESSISELATVPLVSYVASIATSTIYRGVFNNASKKVSYLLGSTICLLACFFLYVQHEIISVYFLAILFGCGSALTTVASLSITADLIGDNTSHGAFLYSFVTFADKLFTGVVIVVTEQIRCKDGSCPEYYRFILATTCGGASVLGLIILGTMK